MPIPLTGRCGKRREDIPELVGYFLNMYNERNDRYVVHIDAKAMQALQDHHWPETCESCKTTSNGPW